MCITMKLADSLLAWAEPFHHQDHSISCATVCFISCSTAEQKELNGVRRWPRLPDKHPSPSLFGPLLCGGWFRATQADQKTDEQLVSRAPSLHYTSPCYYTHIHTAYPQPHHIHPQRLLRKLAQVVTSRYYCCFYFFRKCAFTFYLFCFGAPYRISLYLNIVTTKCTKSF